MFVTGMIDSGTPFAGAFGMISESISGQLGALRPLVRAVVAKVMRESIHHPDVEDATQEALGRAIEGQARLRPGQPLRPWLLGIARHVALDQIRGRVRAARTEVRDEPTASRPGSQLEQVPDSAPGADIRCESGQNLERIRQVMAQLAEDQRQALVLFHIEGLGYREIAERMEVPVGTVGTWISRGRRSIVEALAQGGQLS